MAVPTYFNENHIYGYMVSISQYMDTRQLDYVRRFVRDRNCRKEIYELINSDIEKKHVESYYEGYHAYLRELSSLKKKKVIKRVEKFLCLDGIFDDRDRRLFYEIFKMPENYKRVKHHIKRCKKQGKYNWNSDFVKVTKNTIQALEDFIHASYSILTQIEDNEPQLKNEIEKHRKWLAEEKTLIERIEINMPTVALIGRTMSGKSTLFYALSHKCKEFIGKGKQRTSKVTISATIRGIKTVDTPGLDAAAEKGREDERKAIEAIKDADYVCFIVNNDTINDDICKYIYKMYDDKIPYGIVSNFKDLDLYSYSGLLEYIDGKVGIAQKPNAYLNVLSIGKKDNYSMCLRALDFDYLRRTHASRNVENIKYRLLLYLHRKKIISNSGFLEFRNCIRKTVITNSDANRKSMLQRRATLFIQKTNELVDFISDCIEEEKTIVDEEIRIIDRCAADIEVCINACFFECFDKKYDDDDLKKQFGKIKASQFDVEVQRLLEDIVESSMLLDKITEILAKNGFLSILGNQKAEIKQLERGDDLKEVKKIYGSDIQKALNYSYLFLSIGGITFPVLIPIASVVGITNFVGSFVHVKNRKQETKSIFQERCDIVKQIVEDYKENWLVAYLEGFRKQSREKKEAFNERYRSFQLFLNNIRYEIKKLEKLEYD